MPYYAYAGHVLFLKFDASAQVRNIQNVNLKTLQQSIKPNNNKTRGCKLRIQLVMEGMFKGITNNCL